MIVSVSLLNHSNVLSEINSLLTSISHLEIIPMYLPEKNNLINFIDLLYWYLYKITTNK